MKIHIYYILYNIWISFFIRCLFCLRKKKPVAMVLDPKGFCESLGLLLGRSERERDKDSEGSSVWKQLRSNLAANLLPFSHINLKRGNGPRRAGDWQTCNHWICIFSDGLWAICVRSSLQNTFLILALINNPPMPLCNETQRNVFKYEANHILRTQSSDWGQSTLWGIGFGNEKCKWKCVFGNI